MSGAGDPVDGESPYSIRAVTRVLDILDVLQESPKQSPEGCRLREDGRASLAEIAAAAGLPTSSAFRYLTTLERRGYVERDAADGTYRLGLAFLPLRNRHLDVLARIARPHLAELRDRFQETANLGALDGNRLTYLEIVESPLMMRLAARRGDRDPIHSTALGKAVASQLKEEEVRRIIAAEGLPQLTSRTITELDDFLRELEKVRTRGFALDSGENEEGARCVAVALSGTRIPAAISVSAPAVRFSPERAEEAAAVLLHTAGKLAAELERADA